MATALLCLAGLDAAHAAPAGPGWAAVGQLLQTFDGAGSSKGSKAVAKVGSGPSSLIDYQEMSVRCLGKKDWDSLSATQRTQFIASLKGLVEQRYYPRWRKIFGKGKVTFQDETAQGGDIVVRTKLLLGKKEELLAWRVADQSGAQKIVSLSVSNSDLLKRLKSRIKARQQKVGFDALLAWMKGRSTEDMGGSSGSALASAGGSHAGSSSIVMPIAAVRSPGLSAGAAASISD
jgi:ABC-type transporter MlaC component